MQTEARFLTTRNTLIIDEQEIPIVEIDHDAILSNSMPVIAVFTDSTSDYALLFRPYQLVQIQY
jgi:hypothetical protein